MLNLISSAHNFKDIMYFLNYYEIKRGSADTIGLGTKPSAGIIRNVNTLIV